MPKYEAYINLNTELIVFQVSSCVWKIWPITNNTFYKKSKFQIWYYYKKKFQVKFRKNHLELGVRQLNFRNYISYSEPFYLNSYIPFGIQNFHLKFITNIWKSEFVLLKFRNLMYFWNFYRKIVKSEFQLISSEFQLICSEI